MSCPLHMTVLVFLDHDSLLVMWTPRNLKLSTCSIAAPSKRMGACSVVFFLLSTIISYVLIKLRESLLSWYHTVRSLISSLIGCVAFVGVIGKLNNDVGVMPGRAVISEQGVQEGTEHAPLWGLCVEDQRGRCRYLTLAPGGNPSGSPGSSYRGKCLAPGFFI